MSLSTSSTTEALHFRCRNFQTLGQVLVLLAEESRLGITFVQGGRENRFLSYGRLYDVSLQVLGRLQERGLQPGDEVVFQLADEQGFIIAFWACILGGFVPVPVTLSYHEEIRDKLSKIIRELSSPYVLTDREGADNLRKLFIGIDDDLISFFEERSLLIDELLEGKQKGIPLEVRSNNLAFIQYSSGSTGDPKGVMLTHRNLLTNIAAMIEGAAITERDSTISWMPLTHDMGLIGFHLTPLTAAINQYIMPAARFLRNPLHWMEVTSWKQVTILSSPNFGYHFFLKALAKRDIQSWDLSHVRLIFNGAEPISLELCYEFLEALAPYGLKQTVMFPVYGLAEASLAVTFPEPESPINVYTVNGDGRFKEHPPGTKPQIDTRGSFFPAVGKPVAHCEVSIRDKENRRLGARRIGQITIRGQNVTRGYYHNPGATRNAISSEGWLRTGDMGFLNEGELVITGRAKDIFFKNGQNFYAHDVERLVEKLEGVGHGKACVCCVYRNNMRKSHVIVFIQFKRSVAHFAPLALQVRKYLSRQFGLDVSAVLPVGKLPRTTSGKLRRHVLEEAFDNGEFKQIFRELKQRITHLLSNREITLPTRESHIALAQLWTDILDIRPIGVEDNFFELGGDSLRASDLAVQLRIHFNAQVTLREIFINPTLHQMAALVEQNREGVADYILPTPPRASYALTSEQARLYFLCRMDPESVAYNNCRVFEIKGELDRERLETALNELIARHEILRTAFVMEDEEPVQKVLDELKVTLIATQAEDHNLTIRLKALMQPFDLAKPPLLRAALLDLSPQRHLLFLDIHHIICDGTSLGMLLNEWFRLFGGNKAAPVKVHYRDYAVWQHQFLKTPLAEKQGAFWLDKLGGNLPRLNLSTDMPRKQKNSDAGDRVAIEINADLTIALRALAQRYQVTVSMVLLTVFKVMLAKYTGQNQILVGTVMAGRNHPGQELMLGMFVKTVVLRSFVLENKPFEDLLGEVKSQFLDLYDQQDYPFEQVVKALEYKPDPGRNPIFDVAFVFQNFRVSRLWPKGLDVAQFPFFPRIAKFDLTLEANENGPTINCFFDFRPDLFYRKTIRHMAEHFHYLISQVAADSATTCGELYVLPAQEAWLIFREFYGHEHPYPKGYTVPRLLEKRVSLMPDQTYVIDREEHFSYAAINRKANQLARYLSELGVGPESRVGLMACRSALVPIAILAIWKAGGAYVPVDPDFPLARKRYYLESSGAQWLLSALPADDLKDLVEVIPLTREMPIDRFETTNPATLPDAQNLAYVIFTSGSTGKPKGVMIGQEQLVHYMYFLQSKFPMVPGDRYLVKSSYCFDASLPEMFMAILSGASIFIVPPGDERDPAGLAEIIRHNVISHINLVPSSLKVLLDSFEGGVDPPALKCIRSGGEKMTTQLAARTRARFPHITLANMYGPTETTICATWCLIDEIDPDRDPPIGLPIPNYRIYILNRRGQPQPIGVVGEIYISGIGLGRGYHSPTITASRFLPDPFQKGQRMYRSGDLGRWLPDGRIEYMGRADHQIKLRGYRIELGEIVYHLRRYERVNAGTVAVKRVSTGEDLLCAYYVTDDEIAPQDLRAHLTHHVADYMVPTHYVQLEGLPLLPSGKIDYSRLPEPGSTALIRARYEPARNRLEEYIAESWQHILELERIGRYDHFFELGGHSLMATRAVHAIGERLGLTVPVRTLFEAPRVAEFAERVAALRARETLARDWQDALANVKMRLNSPLEASTFEHHGTWHIWFTDEAPETVRKVLFDLDLHQMMPHYLMPAYHLEDVFEADGGALSDEAFAHMLELDKLDLSSEAFRQEHGSAVVSPRHYLNEANRGKAPKLHYETAHHPKWFVQRNIRSVLFGEFVGHLGLDEGVLLKALNQFIEKQHLLHSYLVERAEIFEFWEFEPPQLERLKVIDLSHCPPEYHRDAMEIIRELLREDLLAAGPLDTLLYNFAVVNLGFREYRVIFAFDHIIADHDTARVVSYHFNPLNSPPDKEGNWHFPNYVVESHQRFIELSRLKEGDPKFAAFKGSRPYREYRELVLSLRQQYPSGQQILYSKPYHLLFTPPSPEVNAQPPNYLGWSLLMTLFAVAHSFELEKVPLRVLVNRRIFRGLSFFNTVGDFHDSIPVVLSGRNMSLEDCYREFRMVDQVYSDAGYNLSSLGEDEDVYLNVFKSPFNLNYVGELTRRQEREVLAQARPLSFISYPVYAYAREGQLGMVLFHGLSDAVAEQFRSFLTRQGGSGSLEQLEACGSEAST